MFLSLKRYFFYLFFLLFSVFCLSSYAQNDEMFREKRFRKKVWRRWSKKKDAYNPYLGRKGTHTPSGKMRKENARHEKKMRKKFLKQMKENKRQLEKRD
jgi:hypothetical protein